MRFLFIVISISAFAQTPDLSQECFEQNRARSCVRLGTTLWQDVSKRDEARKAFAKGCELKEESACTLMELKKEKTETVQAPVAEPVKPKEVVKEREQEQPHSVNGIRKIGKNEFSVQRMAALTYTQNLPETLHGATMEAKTLPGGAVEGYRFVQVEKGSVFEALGFVPGDVITHVNGRAVKSASEATAMLPSLAYQKRYEFKINRGGKTVVQKYQVVD